MSPDLILPTLFVAVLWCSVFSQNIRQILLNMLISVLSIFESWHMSHSCITSNYWTGTYPVFQLPLLHSFHIPGDILHLFFLFNIGQEEGVNILKYFCNCYPMQSTKLLRRSRWPPMSVRYHEKIIHVTIGAIKNYTVYITKNHSSYLFPWNTFFVPIVLCFHDMALLRSVISDLEDEKDSHSSIF